MNTNIHIASIEFNKSFYHPSEMVQLNFQVRSEADISSKVQLVVAITHLAETVDQLKEEFSVERGNNSLQLNFKPPEISPRGYGLNISLEDTNGEALDSASAGFDVLDHWTQSPRYGFLSDFPPGREDAAETIATLNRYHINSLQFYDWMYKHEQLLTAEEPYVDLLDRQLSLETVKNLISSAHESNMAAMPYTAVYGASMDFYNEHPDWALLKADGKPELFGDDYLVIMDIKPGSPWVEHMMNEFDLVLSQTAFDGIHLDQYGDPKEGYDSEGNKYGLEEPLADFINKTKAHVLKQREDGAVVFNAVTSWPVENVAPADQDLVYIEVWPPYRWFNDLHNLIVNAQELGNRKAVVLAAYLDPQHIHNVLISDAVIFASGGGHIELGENNAILADPYFPEYKPVSPDLSITLQKYYDFTVRYQDVIGPRAKDATAEYSERIVVSDSASGEEINTARNAVKNKIWPIVRSGDGFVAISLINLLGVDDPDWKKEIVEAPTSVANLSIRVDDFNNDVSKVWMATPDRNDLSTQQLSFTEEDGSLVFEIPSLSYWDLVVIEWKD